MVAKNERFVWIACSRMPPNAWNVSSFRAIGSIWIELDSDTLREVSFAKGRLLIATENPNRIEGEVQLIVNGRRYNVRVVEEETFRTVISTYQVTNPEAEEEDEVDKTDGDRNASSKKNGDLMDDMEKQKTSYSFLSLNNYKDLMQGAEIRLERIKRKENENGESAHGTSIRVASENYKTKTKTPGHPQRNKILSPNKPKDYHQSKLSIGRLMHG
ncbi:hypothetical protein RHMOL_Rhmol10G0199800 [Rhododendron molle]|uniref:Uncharacterized protein n=1 Tax=Rhododendron molle TaxID=49168 RepID=A0ACC0M3Y8_RHOML|nr:hypothetical protein RHMOL_Rhmol10G0199800 [Rhododendron molle]